MAVSADLNSGIAAPRDEVVGEAAGFSKAGFFGRSLALLDRALREHPRDRDLLYARALTLLDWGRLNEALAGLRAAREAGFASFGLFVNLSQTCHACGLTDEAEQHALQAITLDESQAAGHLCLAAVRQAAKRYEDAIRSFERGYALAPERVDCLWEIVSCLLDQKDATAAETVARRAISIHGEGHARSWALLASALAMQHRWDEAMAAFEQAEAIEARNGLDGDTFVMHGLQLFWSGQLSATTDLYRRYLPRSVNPLMHAHLGLVLLTAGRLREGWPFYEFRWTVDRLLAIRPRLGRPEWRGQELRGRRLLLWAEQGVGDIVQFVRHARAFKERGATVLLYVPDRLRAFAHGFRDVDRVVCEPAEIADAFDYHLSLMSAPGALGIDLASIPSEAPYIAVDPERKQRWRERVACPGVLKVGLAWAGNPTHEHDHLRSIALSRLAPLFGVEGVRFYSLQKESRAEDAGALPAGADLIDLAPELVDFRDTAAAIEALDLVIAVDTAVVHIAGALAKPAWVLLQTPPDFRWLTEGDDSRWYPTIRLFRQQRLKEWDEVIADVREALVKASRIWQQDSGSAASLMPIASEASRVAAIPQHSISTLCGITDTRYGIVQYLRREEMQARSLEFYGEWLQPHMDFVAMALKPGGAAIEAGSGVGAHTLELAKLVGATGTLFAYEPDHALARVLFQNLHTNQIRNQVTIMERWLGASSGSSEAAEADAPAEGKQADACDTVDDLALNRLDLLKINSARAARGILEGAADTLWRLRPLLLVVSDREDFGTLADRVESFGYRCWRIVTPYFSAANHSGRIEDIFDGRSALALVGVPEEVEPPALLAAYEELSGSQLADHATPVSQYNAAMSLLMRGDYKRGFELYECRFDAVEDRAAPARKFERSLSISRRWRGEPLSGRRIVVWCEQGFGDNVMMLRYLPLLKSQGAKEVIVVCERELIRLVRAMPAVDGIVSAGDALEAADFDLQCPMMSLPSCFGSTFGSIPREMPYLAVPETKVQQWQQRLAALDGLKVGLAWAGGETLKADSLRSIPLAAFEPLFRVPGVQIVSLQKDRRPDDFRAGLPLVDWMSECSDFLETAALIEALDLVISVDTAVAHVAGARAKQVWLLNRSESEWRWGRGLARSPWYPTMTIFNQRNAQRWNDVIEDVVYQLGREVGHDSGVVPAYELPAENFEESFQSGSRSLQRGDPSAAEARFRDATHLRAESAPAWNGLGIALALQDRHTEARVALRRAVELEDNGGERCDSFVNLANSLTSEGHLQEGLAVYRKHLPTRPSPQGHHNYALTLLGAGELIEGWRHYEFRWLVEPLASLQPRYRQPEWSGQDLRGKTILLHCEQGLGDTIQFIRHAAQLKALGARVVLLVQPELRRLAQGFGDVDAVVEESSGLPFDYYVPLLSLPRVFGTDLSSIPADVPYIEVDAERVASWAESLARDAGPKVGVVWAGSASHSRDKNRSLQLSALDPILDVPGIRFYSLQKPLDGGVAVALGNRLVDLGPRLADFADTAAAISQMDLVLCVDTSVAHVAGALGRAVWVMLPQPADFRWSGRSEDSPWYPSMRLFRQSRPGSWEDVIARVESELRNWARSDHASRATVKDTKPGPSDPRHVSEAPQPPLRVHRAGMSAVANTRFGYLQYLPDETAMGDSLALYGEHLQNELDFVARLLSRGATVLEVGAGIGLHATFLASVVGAEGRVYVHESRPVMRRILQQNLAANHVRNATVMQGAFDSTDAARTEISSETLADLQLQRLDLVKTNSREAAMNFALSGSDILWRLRPMLFMSNCDDDGISALSERVRDYGYRCWRIEVPLFSPGNFNNRDHDIFSGRQALSLFAMPEEAPTPDVLDGFPEVT